MNFQWRMGKRRTVIPNLIGNPDFHFCEIYTPLMWWQNVFLFVKVSVEKRRKMSDEKTKDIIEKYLFKKTSDCPQDIWMFWFLNLKNQHSEVLTHIRRLNKKHPIVRRTSECFGFWMWNFNTRKCWRTFGGWIKNIWLSEGHSIVFWKIKSETSTLVSANAHSEVE